MGTIMSPVEAIDRIRWKLQPEGKPLDARRVIIVPGHNSKNIMVAELADGTYVCSHDLSAGAYMPGKWPWTTAVMTCLARLGAITHADKRAHLDLVQAGYDRKTRANNAHWLQRSLNDAGLEPSLEQAAYIAANRRESENG